MRRGSQIPSASNPTAATNSSRKDVGSPNPVWGSVRVPTGVNSVVGDGFSPVDGVFDGGGGGVLVGPSGVAVGVLVGVSGVAVGVSVKSSKGNALTS
jgi:hypothetical protein